MDPIRWLGRNLSTLLLAIVLAVAVWVSAVVAADPNQEGVYGRSIPIEIRGQDSDLIMVSPSPGQARVTINAPQSIWTRLTNNPSYVRAWIDLSGLGPGEHNVNVRAQVGLAPSTIIAVEPEEVTVVLEQLVYRTMSVSLEITGDPAPGRQMEVASSTPAQVTLSGPKSVVARVQELRASIDISGAIQSVQKTVPVQALDANGAEVDEITILPQQVTVSQPISLLGGYRNVVVKVVTSGRVADGYWLTNISVSPPNVTVFSTDPQLVNDLPGWVETRPLDLTGVTDDMDVRVQLNLPEGVTLVGGESVLVRVGVAALEGNRMISLTPEIEGLPPELKATISPEIINVILSGPLPALTGLTPAAFRVTLGLSGLGPGAYPVTPVMDLLPPGINIVSMMPEAVQVTITVAPTLTPTPETTVTPTLGVTVTPTPTATQTPVPTAIPTARRSPRPNREP